MKIDNFKKKILKLLDNEYYALFNNYNLELDDIDYFTHPFMDNDIKPFNFY